VVKASTSCETPTLTSVSAGPVHTCVGANLARLTVNLMFEALADAVPDLSELAPPERLRSGWLNGIKHWHVSYGAGGAGTPPTAG
jgi:cholest-4-en-3-one 26-monooxygenase